MKTYHQLSVLFALAVFCLPSPAQTPTNDDIMKAIKDLEMLVQKSNVSALQELIDLRKRVQSLEKSVELLQQKSQDRVSLYPAQVSTGTIRLENRLAVGTTILVNDVAYRLQPFQVRDLPAYPAGTFTFEALVDGYGSLQPRATRILEPNRIFTIFTYLP